ncbi:MAG: glycosyltransferase [Burkholderiaceae bacterium]
MNARDVIKKKPRIAIVTSIHPDFDARIWKHATSLARSGYNIHLICPWAVDEGAVIEGVSFHPFARVIERRKRFFLVPIRVWGKLKPLMETIDIVHFHDIDLLPWMALLCTKKHVVYDVHENYPEEMLIKEWIPVLLRKPLSRIVSIGQRFLASIIRNVVLVVDSQDPDFDHPRINKVHIWNYASVKLLESVADDYMERQECIIFTGTHYVANGSLLLMEIMERLHKLRPALKLMITDGMFSQEVSRELMLEEVTKRGLQDAVIFVPRVNSQEIMTVLNRATVAIVPVLRVPKAIRGVPNKLFEYMAAGLPVVSSDLPYQEKIIKNSQAGYLARPEDPDSFVVAIQKLLDDKDLALDMGKNGQKIFQHRYSWEGQLPRLLAFYDAIFFKEAGRA